MVGVWCAKKMSRAIWRFKEMFGMAGWLIFEVEMW